LAHSTNFQRALTAFALQLELQLIYRRIAAFLERHSDALNDNIMDFASFIKGDPAQRLVNGITQIDARMNDTRPRLAACGLRWGISFAR
jgi:hypothetical protein